MKKDSIIYQLVNDENVNLYTKLLIFLYFNFKYTKNLQINDALLIKRLRLIDNISNRKKIQKNLSKMVKIGILEITIVKRRRFYKMIMPDLFKYDWLNEN